MLVFSVIGFAACSGQQETVVRQVKTVEVPAVSRKEAVKDLGQGQKFKQVRLLQLQAEQVLHLSGEVGGNIDPLISQLNKLNKDRSVKEIYLLIDSPGGSVLDGARFVSAMEASRKPIHTVCTTMCASMAAIIHQYGSKRLMLDRSILMFHDAAGGLQGSIPQMRTRLNFFDRLTTKMDAYIANRAGVDLNQFMVELHSEVWMDAEDSTDKHFNDEIVYVVVEGERSDVYLDSPVDHSRLINLE